MKFWNYIGESFLFHWLFGSHKHNKAKPDVPDATVNPVDSDSMDDLDSYMRFGRHSDNCSRYGNQDCGYTQSYDDFLDEQDDYDMMDEDF